MMTPIGILLVVFSILVIVDAESLNFRPQARNLLDEAFVDCSAAFHAESLQVEGVPPAARLGLVHRLGPCSPLRSTIPFGSELELTKDMLVHEANRIRFLQSKMEASVWEASKVGATQAPIVSGKSIGTGNYLIKVGLGTPARDLMLVIDTGSEIMWTQCSPCASQTACYSQASTIFDPKASSSFQVVPCGGAVCTSLASPSAGGCAGSVCQYQVNYLDGSFTKGDFSTDTLTVGGSMVAGFQFGCGHDNEGLFKGFDGVMGLDRSPKSFPAQTSATFGQNFAYCLPSPFTNSAGFIEFGSSAAPSATHTPLTSVSSSLYVAGLTSVTVGTTSITPSAGSVPLIVDSGTVISRLSTNLYNDLRDAFKGGVSGLTPAPASVGLGLFDTCFTSSSSTVSIPKITFNLGGGATFSPPANSLLYPLGSGTFCLAFAAIQSASGASILGNFQQQGFRFAFDIVSNTLSVDPAAC